MEKQQQIRTYIIDNFLFGEDDAFDNGQSLLAAGIVDSTGIMELVMFLEETYGIKTSDEDFVPENLDTVDNMVKFVERKLACGDDGPAGSA